MAGYISPFRVAERPQGSRGAHEFLTPWPDDPSRAPYRRGCGGKGRCRECNREADWREGQTRGGDA